METNKSKKEKVIEKVKQAAEIVGSCGAYAFTCGVVRAIIPPGVNAIAQAGICVGGLILSGFVGDKLSDYMGDKIDQTAKEINDYVEEVKRCLDIITDKDLEEKEGEVG